jgi:aerobic-type carbon monoxide dehydrogenase small subunit (CoxS/CutS family)
VKFTIEYNQIRRAVTSELRQLKVLCDMLGVAGAVLTCGLAQSRVCTIHRDGVVTRWQAEHHLTRPRGPRSG